MLSDEQRAALDAAVRAFAATGDGDGLDEVAFAAGIAYAQTWRSMESAPKGWAVMLRDERGNVCVALWRHSEQEWVIIGGGGAIMFEPTGWLPLPPTEAK